MSKEQTPQAHTPGPWTISKVYSIDYDEDKECFDILGPSKPHQPGGSIRQIISTFNEEGSAQEVCNHLNELLKETASAPLLRVENEALKARVGELEATINKMKVNNLRTIMEPVPEDEFNEIIDSIETRAMASDGPVTPTLQEATEEELSRLWELIQEISPKRKRLQVLALALDNATEYESVREYLRFEGLDPDQVGREGSVFVKTITRKLQLEYENARLREALEKIVASPDDEALLIATAALKTPTSDENI